ncbi:hypothetical protein MMC34_001115 [Xylographa carneopallida]|nr:hypothetical protein [Xylographa carneopallida]
MAFLISHDREKMDNSAWKNFLEGTVVEISGGRAISFEWNLIKKKVDEAVENKKTSGAACKHYVPHQKIKEAIQTILEAKRWARLSNDLRACLPDYKPRPKYGYTPEDLENYKAKCDTDTAKWKSHPEKEFEASSKETLKQQTRMAFEVWTVWDVEVICDYPDNLFYGNGRGDQNGTAVDVPNDTGSKEKVKAGAMSLYEALEGKLTIVNKHGNPSIDKMVSED